MSVRIVTAEEATVDLVARPGSKPYLRVVFPGDMFGTQVVCLSVGAATLIGDVARRYEEAHHGDRETQSAGARRP
jgi:hypothetical protein